MNRKIKIIGVCLVVLLFSLCTLKKKKIGIDELYDKYGGALVIFGNKKYYTYPTKLKNEEIRKTSVNAYEYVSRLFEDESKVPISISIQLKDNSLKVQVPYILSDYPSSNYLHIGCFTTSSTQQGTLVITQRKDNWIEGYFNANLVCAETVIVDYTTGKDTIYYYYSTASGKFKLYVVE
jgi:hypothetical protein